MRGQIIFDEDDTPCIWVGDLLVPLRFVETNIGVRLDPETHFVYALRAWRQ